MLGVEICHFLYLRPVAYITACTTVQAVIILCAVTTEVKVNGHQKFWSTIQNMQY